MPHVRMSVSLLLGLLLALSGVRPASAQAPLTTSLFAAADKGLVHLEIRGNGSCSGDSIVVEVSRTAVARGRKLVLSVPSGSTLSCSERGEQDMVVAALRGRVTVPGRYTPRSVMVLTDDQPATYLLEAYCAEFKKDNPAAGREFLVRGSDAILARVLAEAKRQGLSTRATQAAVWQYTDDISYEQLVQKFPLDPDEWAQAVAAFQMARAGGAPVESPDPLTMAEPVIPAPVPAPVYFRTVYRQVITKRCSRCGHTVPASARAGQRCRYCGAYWAFETRRTGNRHPKHRVHHAHVLRRRRS